MFTKIIKIIGGKVQIHRYDSRNIPYHLTRTNFYNKCVHRVVRQMIG